MGLFRPGPPTDLVLKIKDTYHILDFIETGTSHGNTAIWAADHFANVITIELSEEIHGHTALKHGDRNNIKFLWGNSHAVLKDIIPESTRPSVFWLDAHWSAGDTAGKEEECPLVDEIAEINKSDHTHFIFIDDARLFESPPPLPHSIEQWPSIDKVIEALQSASHKYYIVVIEDVIIAVPDCARQLVAGYCQRINTQAHHELVRQSREPVLILGLTSLGRGARLVLEGLGIQCKQLVFRLVKGVMSKRSASIPGTIHLPKKP